MTDLALTGPLNLQGLLNLAGDGGKVTAGGVEVLVEGAKGQGTAPVMLPPPPVGPSDPALDVALRVSFNQTVKAAGKAIVTQGICIQGSPGTWPGIVQPSSVNAGPAAVKVANVAANVVGDMATILPVGAPATFTGSGQ